VDGKLAEDMLAVRKPPQRSEDQLPKGHMSEPMHIEISGRQVGGGQDALEMTSAAKRGPDIERVPAGAGKQ